MREFLFKAKRIDNGEWVEGYYQKRKDAFENDEHLIFRYESYHTWEYIKVDPETICQYTGLTDKNGNKIWENDILQIPDDWDNYGFTAGKKYQVFFGYGGFRLKPKNPKFKGFWLDDVEETEVIGNIFDNPELLKAGV